MASTYNPFEITDARIISRLNFTNNENDFGGSSTVIDADEMADTKAEFSSYVIDRLPPRIKRLCTFIDGQWLAGNPADSLSAAGGETEFDTGMLNISNVKLYKNYAGKWNQKRASDQMDSDEYTVDSETGIITLAEPLEENDSLIATYNHSNLSNCLTLKRIVIDLIAAHFAKQVYADEEKLTSFTQIEQQAYSDLKRVRDSKEDGAINLDFFDRLALVNETVNDKTSGVANIRYGSGMLE